MMPARARHHLGPDHRARQCCRRGPAEQECQGIVSGIVEEEILQDGGDERDGTGCCDRRGPVAAEYRAGCELATDGADVRQRLVEIAHRAVCLPWLCVAKYRERRGKGKQTLPRFAPVPSNRPLRTPKSSRYCAC